jgi:hypothetical protein
MTIATTAVLLSGAVAVGASFDAPYPAGHNYATLYEDATHVILTPGGEYTSATVLNNGRGVTVINSTGRTLFAGERVTIEINVTARTTDLSWRVTSLLSGMTGEFGTIAFSRASANATVIDHKGLMHACVNNEARKQGLRRVYNACPDTDNLTTGWTIGSSTTRAAAAVASPNHTRASAWTYTRTSTSANMLTLNSQSFRPGKWTFSAWVMGDGAQTYTIRIERSSDSVGASQTVTPAAGVLTRIAIAYDIPDSTNHRAYLSNASAGAASFTVLDPQMEYTHGTSGAPSEFVPRGVVGVDASSYDAAADGVRYFQTVNPWSLSSGVATAITNPAPIAASTMKGLLIEPLAVNRFFSSRDIGAAQWTLTGSTAASSMTDSTLLGTASIRKLEEAAATAEHRFDQAWNGTLPVDNNIITITAYVKAAERSIFWLGFRGKDGSTESVAYFNVATMTLGTVTGTNAEADMRIEGDLVRLSFSANCGTGASAPVGRGGVTTTDNVKSYAGTLASGGWFGALQMEENAVATSYVGDTGAAATLTRAVDTCTATLTGIPTVGITFSLDYTPMFRTSVANKDSWWYIWYATINQDARFGFALRPDVYGGHVATGADEWVFDSYPHNQDWDGIDILSGLTTRAGDTTKIQIAIDTVVRNGSSNMAGFVGGTKMVNAGSATQGLRPLPIVSPVIGFGRRTPTATQRGPMCIKNLMWRPVASSDAEMAAAA